LAIFVRFRTENPNFPRDMARFDSGIRYDQGAHYDEPEPPPAPFPPQKPKRSRNMPDYIPQSYKNLRDWLTLQQTELTTARATAIGMTAEERTQYLAAVGVLQPLAAEIADLMDQLEAKTADFEPVLAAQVPIVRASIKRAKTSPGCTPGIQEQHEWVGDSRDFDPATARPTIKVEAQRGRVKVDGRKPGFDAVNIYFRLKGGTEWKLIAPRKRKFPFYDETPLAVPGTPEVREYMIIGVIDDEEIGQPSEIKEVVFAG
jgi:hypothetical protein